MSRRSLMIIICFALLVFLCLLITQHHEPESPPPYDAIATNPKHLWTGADGSIIGEISAIQASINSIEGIVLLQNPSFSAIDQKNRLWHVNAEKGSGNESTESLLLENHVKIVHQTTPPTYLSTPSITIYPRQQKAITQETVLIKQGDSFIEARGMIIDFKTGNMTLQQQAQGRYQNETPSEINLFFPTLCLS